MFVESYRLCSHEPSISLIYAFEGATVFLLHGLIPSLLFLLHAFITSILFFLLISLFMILILILSFHSKLSYFYSLVVIVVTIFIILIFIKPPLTTSPWSFVFLSLSYTTLFPSGILFHIYFLPSTNLSPIFRSLYCNSPLF